MDEKSAEANAILAELTADAAKLDSLYVSYEDKEAALTDEIAKEAGVHRRFGAGRRGQKAGRGAAQTGRRKPSARRGEPQAGRGKTTAAAKKKKAARRRQQWQQFVFLWMAVSSPTGGCDQRLWLSGAPGDRSLSFHTGVDLGAAEGTPIYATRSGTVTTATYSDVYGNYVTINHGDGYSSLYGHMTHYVVSAGEYVSQGEVIGYVGSTGPQVPHLHFTIYYNGSTVNPMDYI